jgi:hypothetical protein
MKRLAPRKIALQEAGGAVGMLIQHRGRVKIFHCKKEPIRNENFAAVRGCYYRRIGERQD